MNVLFKETHCQICFYKRGASLSFNPAVPDHFLDHGTMVLCQTIFSWIGVTQFSGSHCKV